MKNYIRMSLMTCGVAVISSVVTVAALASAGKHNVVQTGGDQCERGAGKLYTVSSAVTPPTDFTHASENTIKRSGQYQELCHITWQFGNGWL